MRDKMRYYAVESVALVGVLLAVSAVAAPSRIMYQGSLTAPGGTVVPDGTYAMEFSIWNAVTGGTQLWQETGLSVAVSSGAFSVELGAATAFGTLFDGTASRWIEIHASVGGTMQTFAPRVPITAAANALYATNADKLDSKHATDFANATHGHNLQDLSGAVTDAQVPNTITVDVATNASKLNNQLPAYYQNADNLNTGKVDNTRLNMGAGLGLDADKLDGLESTAFWKLGGNDLANPSAEFLGTSANDVLEIKVNSLRVMRYEPTTGTPNIIGGFNSNSITAGTVGGTIGGGGASTTLNKVTDNYGTVGGGGLNQAGDSAGTQQDKAYATVAGGYHNTASGEEAAIGGGRSNIASGLDAAVAGGSTNSATSNNAFIGGGYLNTATAGFTSVGGGRANAASADYATIAGGGPVNESDPDTTRNRATDKYCAIGGGGQNQAGNNDSDPANAQFATVAGGQDNIASGNRSFIGGGINNVATAPKACVAGGDDNAATGSYATVGGGQHNEATASYATIAGGGPTDGTTDTRNRATGEWSTIGGGGWNLAEDQFSTVAGGYYNYATDLYGSVGGGYDNTAGGYMATVPGGAGCKAYGDYSFAAGQDASADHQGSFVWADTQVGTFSSMYTNGFHARAAGGFWFQIVPGFGARLTTTQWVEWKDKNFVLETELSNGVDILDALATIPITIWRHKSEDPSIRHLGARPQDLYAAFHLGDSEDGIGTSDANGIALAAIQGLNKKVETQKTEIASQAARIGELERKLAALEAMVQNLAQK